MQAIAETLKDGEPEHPETDPASALLVGDEHDVFRQVGVSCLVMYFFRV